MKQFLVILFIFKAFATLGQECDCLSSFEWLKKTFEENDAGFQYIIDKKGEQSYEVHNQIFIEKVNEITNPTKCESTLRNWLSFFRKAHLEFHYTGKREVNLEEQNKMEKEYLRVQAKIEIAKNEHPLHYKFLTSKLPFSEQLNDKTMYLRIPSFEGSSKALIDSVVFANRKEILQKENLIIDIRNGTGGNDDSYEELMPFIYTNPIRLPTVEFRSTTTNNQRMYEFATNTGMALQFGLNPTKEEMMEFQADFDSLSNHIGEFVNLNSYDVAINELDTVYPFPSNVGILINHNNVSTDEQFILEAKQSKKVKLFGTTTKGGLDMSNLYITYSPDKDFVLVYALTKSLRLPDFAIDDIGIQPDFFFDTTIPEHDWIDYVTKILNE